ncbi:hypothetical protein HXX76_000022 [Chlamydomonas incerta]|uniref:Uncharacterized protein n=1 Tax=Chlamydomonas incerta TaxID=51695 RepID=A0A836B223_CHLIN|nr:hypothetical protein HXX76_000022 [Chlamydomonas incerta]|eukprot:KAG2445400.1 hypothetical protein HXX76_000022 [Chlamydomonas incerta]
MPLPFKLPLDAYILMLPIAYASAAFVAMCYRVPTADPETSSIAYYDDEQKSASVAQRYDNTFKQFFDARIRNHKVGVFQNWMPNSPQ